MDVEVRAHVEHPSLAANDVLLVLSAGAELFAPGACTTTLGCTCCSCTCAATAQPGLEPG
jgi:hypothetical protein